MKKGQRRPSRCCTVPPPPSTHVRTRASEDQGAARIHLEDLAYAIVRTVMQQRIHSATDAMAAPDCHSCHGSAECHGSPDRQTSRAPLHAACRFLTLISVVSESRVPPTSGWGAPLQKQ